MSVLKVNLAAGTITSGIDDTTTSLVSDEFTDLPVISSPDVLYLTLDPSEANGDGEIVQVTAHSASSTSVTVVRGSEGTTARSHGNGETWSAGVSAAVLASVIDDAQIDLRLPQLTSCDNTGATDISSQLDTELTSGGHWYFPAGTYYIGSPCSVTVVTNFRVTCHRDALFMFGKSGARLDNFGIRFNLSDTDVDEIMWEGGQWDISNQMVTLTGNDRTRYPVYEVLEVSGVSGGPFVATDVLTLSPSGETATVKYVDGTTLHLANDTSGDISADTSITNATVSGATATVDSYDSMVGTGTLASEAVGVRTTGGGVCHRVIFRDIIGYAGSNWFNCRWDGTGGGETFLFAGTGTEILEVSGCSWTGATDVAVYTATGVSGTIGMIQYQNNTHQGCYAGVSIKGAISLPVVTENSFFNQPVGIKVSELANSPLVPDGILIDGNKFQACSRGVENRGDNTVVINNVMDSMGAVALNLPDGTGLASLGFESPDGEGLCLLHDIGKNTYCKDNKVHGGIAYGPPLAVCHGVILSTKLNSIFNWMGSYNASTNSPDLDVSPSGIVDGDYYQVSVAGNLFGTAVSVGDHLVANQDDPVDVGDWDIYAAADFPMFRATGCTVKDNVFSAELASPGGEVSGSHPTAEPGGNFIHENTIGEEVFSKDWLRVVGSKSYLYADTWPQPDDSPHGNIDSSIPGGTITTYAASISAVTNNDLCWCPFLVPPGGITLDQVKVSVATAGSGSATVQFWIWKGAPYAPWTAEGSVLWKPAAVDCSTSGQKSVDSSMALDLSPGIHYLLWQANETAIVMKGVLYSWPGMPFDDAGVFGQVAFNWIVASGNGDTPTAPNNRTTGSVSNGSGAKWPVSFTYQHNAGWNDSRG